MNLPKAIEILTILESRSINNSTMFKKDALKLGIEALKEIHSLRNDFCLPFNHILPSETKC